MTDVEELLRRTFTERERDLEGAAPSLAGVRERSRHRRRQQAAGLVGAAAVVAVLVGSTVALTGGPQQAATAPSASPAPTAATTPTSPAGGLPSYRDEPITSAEGRTSAVIRWAPTWLPDDIGETGRLVSTIQQIRTYGRNGQGPTVLISSLVEGCADSLDIDGHPGAGVAATVAGKPARLWSFQRAPELGTQHFLVAPTAPGHLVCVPTARGGLWVFVTGTTDTPADALRVAGSVRPAAPVEVAVPVSFPGPVGTINTVTVRADDSGTGGWTGVLLVASAYVELGQPDPDAPPPNTTVDDRPAYLTSSEESGAVLTVPLGSDLAAVFTAHWPDVTLAENRDDVLAAARRLQVGATPDYGWLSR